MESAEAKIINIARDLAGALGDWAYTRKDDDKKRVNRLQHELCQAVKEEQMSCPTNRE